MGCAVCLPFKETVNERCRLKSLPNPALCMLLLMHMTMQTVIQTGVDHRACLMVSLPLVTVVEGQCYLCWWLLCNECAVQVPALSSHCRFDVVEAHSCIELIPLANFWATTQLFIILTSRRSLSSCNSLQDVSRCQDCRSQLGRHLVTSWHDLWVEITC